MSSHSFVNLFIVIGFLNSTAQFNILQILFNITWYNISLNLVNKYKDIFFPFVALLQNVFFVYYNVQYYTI